MGRCQFNLSSSYLKGTRLSAKVRASKDSDHVLGPQGAWNVTGKRDPA